MSPSTYMRLLESWFMGGSRNGEKLYSYEFDGPSSLWLILAPWIGREEAGLAKLLPGLGSTCICGVTNCWELCIYPVHSLESLSSGLQKLEWFPCMHCETPQWAFRNSYQKRNFLIQKHKSCATMGAQPNGMATVCRQGIFFTIYFSWFPRVCAFME